MRTVHYIMECGCCGAWHRAEYDGDCHNDAERFASPGNYANRECWEGDRVVIMQPRRIQPIGPSAILDDVRDHPQMWGKEFKA